MTTVTPPARIVFIGASNMTRGFPVLVELADRAWGRPISILAALGHGRSYGMTSWVLGRRLPAVLDCGLWRRLEEVHEGPTVAFVGDVGNDLVYGEDVETILRWVRECVSRLKSAGAQVILTSLPPTIAELSRVRFLVFRNLFFRRSPLQFESLATMVPALESGLREIAREHDTGFIELRPEWYGLDPIHIRTSRCRQAWSEIVSAAVPVDRCPRLGPIRLLRSYLMRPERQWLFGIPLGRSRPYPRPGGTTVALY
jgi:hypothetical protein